MMIASVVVPLMHSRSETLAVASIVTSSPTSTVHHELPRRSRNWNRFQKLFYTKCLLHNAIRMRCERAARMSVWPRRQLSEGIQPNWRCHSDHRQWATVVITSLFCLLLHHTPTMPWPKTPKMLSNNMDCLQTTVDMYTLFLYLSGKWSNRQIHCDRMIAHMKWPIWLFGLWFDAFDFREELFLCTRQRQRRLPSPRLCRSTDATEHSVCVNNVLAVKSHLRALEDEYRSLDGFIHLCIIYHQLKTLNLLLAICPCPRT